MYIKLSRKCCILAIGRSHTQLTLGIDTLAGLSEVLNDWHIISPLSTCRLYMGRHIPASKTHTLILKTPRGILHALAHRYGTGHGLCKTSCVALVQLQTDTVLMLLRGFHNSQSPLGEYILMNKL